MICNRYFRNEIEWKIHLIIKQRGKLFGRTVPPKNILFGRVVPPCKNENIQLCKYVYKYTTMQIYKFTS